LGGSQANYLGVAARGLSLAAQVRGGGYSSRRRFCKT